MVLTEKLSREQALLRRMRPPELRDLPDAWYEAVVKQATLIARTDFHIRLTEQSIARARQAIADGTWPYRTMERYNFDHGPGESPYTGEMETSFDECDPVTICWLIETVEYGGLANLHVMYNAARLWLDDSDRGKRVSWNGIHQYSMSGRMRTIHSAGLIDRVAPLTWTLDELGRDLLDLVFG